MAYQRAEPVGPANTLIGIGLPDAMRVAIPTAIPSLIDAAVAAFDADRDTSRRYLMRASALLRVRRGACADAEGTRPWESRGGLLAWQLNRVVDYIETHLAEKIMAMDLADLANVSVGQLIRAFKISVGVPPFHYIASRRVELACMMMSTTREPLSQIAIACGLCDQAHLCKVFRRMIGMSPSAWRREQEMSGVGNLSLGLRRRFYDWRMHCPEHEPLRKIILSAPAVARVPSPGAVKKLAGDPMDTIT